MSHLTLRSTSGGGAGTVTSFSFTDANGFDGTVTNPTTTPNLTLATTVGNFQPIYANSGALVGAGVGTAGQVLTSGGAGVSPSFQNAATGTVTSFSFTDANGFDGTVTNSTTTPNLTLTTTVANTRVMYSNSGAITGDADLTYNATTNDLSTGILSLPPTTPTEGYITIAGDIVFASLFTNNLFVGGFLGNPSAVIGAANIAITAGQGSLQFLTSGSDNVAVRGLFSLITGSNNVAIKSNDQISSGNNNLFIQGGDNYLTSESNNINLVALGQTGESNTLRIGESGSGDFQVNRCFIAGITGVTTSNSQNVTIDTTTGQLGASPNLTGTAVVTAPADSAASTLALGVAYQNTTGHDVLLHVYIAVSTATTASILSGVGSTNTPTQQTIVSGLSVAALSIIPVTVYLPNNYYALISTSGTITASISGQQITAV